MYTLQVRQSWPGVGRWKWRILDTAGSVIVDNPTVYFSEDDARRSGECALAYWKHTEARSSPRWLA
jgi:hypothetical protein